MSQVVNHLLFHKAMVGVDIDRVDQYIEIQTSRDDFELSNFYLSLDIFIF